MGEQKPGAELGQLRTFCLSGVVIPFHQLTLKAQLEWIINSSPISEDCLPTARSARPPKHPSQWAFTLESRSLKSKEKWLSYALISQAMWPFCIKDGFNTLRFKWIVACEPFPVSFPQQNLPKQVFRKALETWSWVPSLWWLAWDHSFTGSVSGWLDHRPPQDRLARLLVQSDSITGSHRLVNSTRSSAWGWNPPSLR